MYSQARAEFDAAAHALAETGLALGTAEASEARIRGLIELREHEQERLRETANEQAAELYMEGVSGTASALFMSTPVEAIAAASSSVQLMTSASTSSTISPPPPPTSNGSEQSSK